MVVFMLANLVSLSGTVSLVSLISGGQAFLQWGKQNNRGNTFAGSQYRETDNLVYFPLETKLELRL